MEINDKQEGVLDAASVMKKDVEGGAVDPTWVEGLDQEMELDEVIEQGRKQRFVAPTGEGKRLANAPEDADKKQYSVFEDPRFQNPVDIGTTRVGKREGHQPYRP